MEVCPADGDQREKSGRTLMLVLTQGPLQQVNTKVLHSLKPHDKRQDILPGTERWLGGEMSS